MNLRIELFVDDLDASIEFYSRLLGFAVQWREGGYAKLRNGSVTLGFGLVARLPRGHPLRPEIDGARKGSGVEIVLEVDDVETALARVTDGGYPIESPLMQRPWGLTDFRIVDPDGYYLRITTKA